MTRRRAFTLVELLVAVVILGVVGGALGDGLRRQQRVFRSIASMVAVHGDTRDGAEVLAADLASVSPLDTIPMAADSAFETYVTIVSSVACDSGVGYTLRLPPEKLIGGHTLTSLLATPDSGDTALVYVHDTTAAGHAGRWGRHLIAGTSTQPAETACPQTSGLTTPADASSPAFLITLRGAGGSAIRAGAPVRIVRRVRYSLYRSSDGKSYLGNRRCDPLGPSVCGTIQPVSGPYAAFSRTGASGAAFRFFGARNTLLPATTMSSLVERVEVTVRSAAITTRGGGTRVDAYTDSAVISLALRNRE